MLIIHRYIITLIVLFPVVSGCEKDGGSKPDKKGEWLIPEEEVRDGGPGKDGIPSIDNPEFIDPFEADFLTDQTRVIGILRDGKPKAYGHPILNHHEIVNDQVGRTPLSITYCPLTGTGIGISRKINGEVTTFGVSGLLFNSNLIPYDRKTESNWSQMKLQCVNGELKGNKNQFYQVVETQWSTWQAMYPETKVLSRNTDFNRNYNESPYGDYKNNDQLLYPVTNESDRLPKKERVHGIMVGSTAKVYRFQAFQGDTKVIEDEFKGESIILAGNKEKDFIVSFKRTDDIKGKGEFEAIQGELPIIMEDSSGNRYDIFGNIRNGPQQGERLRPTKSYMGFWFAWAAFFPEVTVYNP